MQTHQSQNRLARLIEQELTRINQQQQTNPPSQCQELLDKTTDLMNAVGESFFRCIDHHISFFSSSLQSTSDSSRTKTYLIGELQMLPLSNGKK